MRQFIPFEDDWDMLERMHPDALVPYQLGMPCAHELPDAADEERAAKQLAGTEVAGAWVRGVSAVGGGPR